MVKITWAVAAAMEMTTWVEDSPLEAATVEAMVAQAMVVFQDTMDLVVLWLEASSTVMEVMTTTARAARARAPMVAGVTMMTTTALSSPLNVPWLKIVLILVVVQILAKRHN